MAVPVITSSEREHLRTLVSRQRERAEIREALAFSVAKSSIDRMLGEELIAAAREVIAAYRALLRTDNRMNVAVARLEELIGQP